MLRGTATRLNFECNFERICLDIVTTSLNAIGIATLVADHAAYPSPEAQVHRFMLLLQFYVVGSGLGTLRT